MLLLSCIQSCPGSSFILRNLILPRGTWIAALGQHKKNTLWVSSWKQTAPWVEQKGSWKRLSSLLNILPSIDAKPTVWLSPTWAASEVWSPKLPGQCQFQIQHLSRVLWSMYPDGNSSTGEPLLVSDKHIDKLGGWVVYRLKQPN